MTTLTPGMQIGQYEILGPIGAGDIGEVYKARDISLDRFVALKLVPPHWAADPDLKQRFERDSQTLAGLNHPNICVLHDIGRHEGFDFLVMEYVSGETLSQRLERGALAVDEALKVAIAMADALDKAHRQGVVHRDLKPSNVMLTEGGTKLLDFGLAKVKRPAASSSGTVVASNMTSPGTVLGTLQYAAPEQLEGAEADERTDIFALGAVLHEMVTGKKAFEGKSQVLLMSAIATSDPQPISEIQPATPAALEHVVRTCLAKNSADRWQTARDVLAELQWIAETSGERVIATPVWTAGRKRAKMLRILFAMVCLAALLLAWPGFLYFNGRADSEPLRFNVTLARSPQDLGGVNGPVTGSNFAVSPDGRYLAYVTRGNNNEPWGLYARTVRSLTPQKLADFQLGNAAPFWSGDSRFLAFIDDGKLKRVEVNGGPPQHICEVTGFSGGTWNAEGTILFGTPKGLYRVSAEGGKPEAITTVEASENGHLWPRFLPDGRHYLYFARSSDASKGAIYAGELDSKERTRVMAAESKAMFTEPGYLLFRREGAVFAQIFNPKKMAISGDPVRIADEITYDASTGRGSFDVSFNGALLYYRDANSASTTLPVDERERQLAWVTLQGQGNETVGPPGSYRGVSVSPDGKRIAVHRHDAGGGDVWVMEPRGTVTQLTFTAANDNSMPIWSPDGTRIVFASLRNKKWGLYQTLSSGSGMEELLFESELPKAPMSWSRDGKSIVFWTQDPANAGDLWLLALGDKKATPLIATPANETQGQISPDGKWIAYTSNFSGSNEVYVQPFPSGSGRWRVSPGDGNDWPRWRPDGNELFYHRRPNPARNTAFTDVMYKVTASASGGAFEAGSPQPVVRTLALSAPHAGGDYHVYDISPDGKRLLILQLLQQPAAVASAQLGLELPAGVLTVALNWTNGLKK